MNTYTLDNRTPLKNGEPLKIHQAKRALATARGKDRWTLEAVLFLDSIQPTKHPERKP